jgi:hypothetical protein
MKKVMIYGTYVVLMCAIMSLFCSCAETKLKTAAEAANKECPVSLGITGEMTSVAYEDGAMVFTFTLNEQLNNIDVLAANPESTKASILAGMRNENSKKLFDLIIESDAGLRFVYKGKDSGKEARFDLTAAELKEELEKPAPTVVGETCTYSKRNVGTLDCTNQSADANRHRNWSHHHKTGG